MLDAGCLKLCLWFFVAKFYHINLYLFFYKSHSVPNNGTGRNLSGFSVLNKPGGSFLDDIIFIPVFSIIMRRPIGASLLCAFVPLCLCACISPIPLNQHPRINNGICTSNTQEPSGNHIEWIMYAN